MPTSLGNYGSMCINTLGAKKLFRVLTQQQEEPSLLVPNNLARLFRVLIWTYGTK
jgi:hypothetical protein